jgi:hypothetical protein
VGAATLWAKPNRTIAPSCFARHCNTTLKRRHHSRCQKIAPPTFVCLPTTICSTRVPRLSLRMPWHPHGFNTTTSFQPAKSPRVSQPALTLSRAKYGARWGSASSHNHQGAASAIHACACRVRTSCSVALVQSRYNIGMTTMWAPDGQCSCRLSALTTRPQRLTQLPQVLQLVLHPCRLSSASCTE